ncbi:MAG: hypothetical protein ACI9LS_002114, partial [Flavobacteriales bacterium]
NLSNSTCAVKAVLKVNIRKNIRNFIRYVLSKGKAGFSLNYH